MKTRQQRLVKAERIILENKDYLFRVAYFRVGSRAEAEDIVQSAFVRFWEKSPSLDDDLDIRLYLYRIVFNMCADYGRKKTAKRCSMTDAEDLTDTADNDRELQAEYQRITTLLSQLPLSQRQVIEMHITDGLTFAEISRTLHLPETTLKSRYKTGINNLRTKINKDEI